MCCLCSSLKMRKNSPQLIGNVLKDVVEKLSQAKKDTKIFSSWASCAGKKLSRHSRPARLRQGTLEVFVEVSAWFYQANLQKEELLKGLQQKVGTEKIQKIRFRIGKI